MVIKQRKKNGFTIVELLIVIVVIAILAAISIVAYNGIQDRANDTAIKQDLTNFSKKMQIYKINNGTYPTGNDLDSSLGLAFSKPSYGADQQERNVRYCHNSTTDEYVLVANSKSGNYYKAKSGEGVSSNASTFGWGVCGLVGLSSTNPVNPNGNGYNAGNDPQWRAWTN